MWNPCQFFFVTVWLTWLLLSWVHRSKLEPLVDVRSGETTKCVTFVFIKDTYGANLKVFRLILLPVNSLLLWNWGFQSLLYLLLPYQHTCIFFDWINIWMCLSVSSTESTLFFQDFVRYCNASNYTETLCGLWSFIIIIDRKVLR